MKTMPTTLFRAPLFLLASLCIVPASFAEDTGQLLGDLDISPPVIEHAPFESPMATNGSVSLSATVRDNNAVRSVLVFYRNAGEKNYRQIGLSALGADLYQVTLPLEHVAGNELDYYFQATDSAGNTVLRGTNISPLRLSLQKPDVRPPTQTAVTKVEPATPAEASHSRSWVWWVGGALLAGAAGYAVLGKKDSGSSSSDSGDTGGTIVITAPGPQ